MKLITAIIQPEKLDEVREELIKAKIFRVTVSRCTGRGQAEETNLYRGQEIAPGLISKVRIDIACNDEFTQQATDAIVKAARSGTGRVGDGKIFITPLEECIRIRTGETGNKAI